MGARSYQEGESIGRNRIADAAQAAWAGHLAAQRKGLDASQLRHQVGAVDTLIGLLEERTLDGKCALDPGLREHLHRLESDVGMPLPRNAVRARTTTSLHAILLDWEETLRSDLSPESCPAIRARPQLR